MKWTSQSRCVQATALLLALALAVVLSGCPKKSQQAPPPSPAAEQPDTTPPESTESSPGEMPKIAPAENEGTELAEKFFPMHVGDKWTYSWWYIFDGFRHVDPEPVSEGTISIEITGTEKVGEQEYFVFKARMILHGQETLLEGTPPSIPIAGGLFCEGEKTLIRYGKGNKVLVRKPDGTEYVLFDFNAADNASSPGTGFPWIGEVRMRKISNEKMAFIDGNFKEWVLESGLGIVAVTWSQYTHDRHIISLTGATIDGKEIPALSDSLP